MSNSEIDLVAAHVSECESCCLRIEQLEPSPIAEGFRKAFADSDSSSAEVPVPRRSKKAVEEQVDSILESIRPSDSSISQSGESLFKITEKVGENSFCEIYLATDTMVGSRYFVKFPHRTLIASPDHCSQFLMDARCSSLLEHAQIISVSNFGYWANEDRPYYAIPWHDTPTLDQVITPENRIGLDSLIRIIVQVCVALRAAHQIRIVHRHLSPQSIHVGQEQLVQVAEFAMNYDANYQFGLIQPLQNPTEFHPPEVRDNDMSRIDLRTDIWAFGAVLKWLLQHADIESDSAAEKLARLVRDCQRKSRDNRIQSMIQIQARLIDALQESCPDLGGQ